jgi:dienelactone hydrolase
MLSIVLSLRLVSPTQTDVLSKLYSWRDPQQNREIPVRVSYPKEGKKLPVVVFSHGFRGSEKNLDPLVNEWTKAGYVVFQPRHEDSLLNLPPRERINAFRTNAKSFDSWSSRLADCRFLYSVVGKVDEFVPELKGRLDSAKLLQAGHSFGAHTSQTLGGCKILGREFADPRPIAFCCISPQGIGQGRTKESWTEFKRPLLVISGTKDVSPLDDERTQVDPAVRQDPYKLSAPGDKYLVWIEGANHNFGGITGANIAMLRGIKSDTMAGANPEHVKIVAESTIAFFDQYSGKNPKALQNWGAKQSTVRQGLVTFSTR